MIYVPFKKFSSIANFHDLLFYSKWGAISILFFKKRNTVTKILCNSLNNNKNSSIAWSFFAKIDDFRATKLALDKEHCESMEMKVQSEFLIASNDIFWSLEFVCYCYDYWIKAELLLLKLIQIFAWAYSTFKTDTIKVALVFSISHFFIPITARANKWMRKKYLLAVIQL